jgi:hypothetical protein
VYVELTVVCIDEQSYLFPIILSLNLDKTSSL